MTVAQWTDSLKSLMGLIPSKKKKIQKPLKTYCKNDAVLDGDYLLSCPCCNCRGLKPRDLSES